MGTKSTTRSRSFLLSLALSLHLTAPAEAGNNPATLACSESDEQVDARARRFVARCFGTGGIELATIAVRRGAASHHVVLQQLAGGLPVLGSSLSVHFGRDGRVNLCRRRLFDGLSTATTAALTPSDALAVARAHLGASRPFAEAQEPRLSILPGRAGARLVYECWVVALEPAESYRVIVDAGTAAALSVEDRSFDFDGTGRVFNPSPVVALQDLTLSDRDDSAAAVPQSAYQTVTLRDLFEDAAPPYTLTGPFVTTEGTPERASNERGDFLFDRDDPRFEEVMVYYHVDSIQRRLQSLGFADVCRRQVRAFVNSRPPGIPYDADQARYFPDGKGTGVLAFGTGGVDSAEDAEVIAHEYGHAILDYQVVNFGESREAVALAEGFCDFLSASIFTEVSAGFGDACIGEWKAASSSPGSPHCLRRLDNDKRYPYDMTYLDRYQDSEIWSGALWDLAGSVGTESALQLAIEANFYLERDASFKEAGESILLADEELFGGAHEAAIGAVLCQRGILTPALRIEGFTVKDEEPDASIPDNDPFGFESEVEYPLDRSILSELSLQVYVDIEHSVPPDLRVTLISPSQTEIDLTPPWRFPTIFGPLDEPQSGGFAALVGESAAGLWRLRVVDSAAFETGTLRAWGIQVLNIVRGDANSDGLVGVADALAILDSLFRGGALRCETRGDTNDDSTIDVSDAVYLLLYLFAGGHAPPPPFAAPGADPTPDALSCAEP